MAHRTFKDSLGRAWEVWSVMPEHVERRRKTPVATSAVKERRMKREFRVPLGQAWARGWLVFETKGEKRRLAPIPDDWSALSEERLEQLSRTATRTASSRRLIE